MVVNAILFGVMTPEILKDVRVEMHTYKVQTTVLLIGSGEMRNVGHMHTAYQVFL